MVKPSNKVLLAGGGALLVLIAIVVGAFTVGPLGGVVVEQPIAFPHDIHAGDNQIPCMYCHTTADRSVDAGIPAVQICAGCHIPGGTPMIARDSAGVQQLIAYWREQRPIPWERIYRIPDHAHFPHMRHVNAGVQCQECHGPVETMREIEQYPSLQMGWCVDCHRARQARTDCTVCHY
ncbi:MAG: cytochrome c3 family protein [Gemmatimonadota bacterium]